MSCGMGNSVVVWKLPAAHTPTCCGSSKHSTRTQLTTLNWKHAQQMVVVLVLCPFSWSSFTFAEKFHLHFILLVHESRSMPSQCKCVYWSETSYVWLVILCVAKLWWLFQMIIIINNHQVVVSFYLNNFGFCYILYLLKFYTKYTKSYIGIYSNSTYLEVRFQYENMRIADRAKRPRVSQSISWESTSHDTISISPSWVCA